MAQAKSGDTVRVHYTGRLDDGSVFDSSEGREPLEFVLGAQQVIPGFEEAVDGLSPGEARTVDIPADRAYGPRREEMVLTVGRDQFPDEIRPEVGQQLQMSQDGQVAIVTIIGVSEREVTLDANHPLAGKDLTFDVQLVEIV
ncbi:MAG TPA: peptidylprolyl isomerase [Longimicrobiaceae bacterium]|jgi:FKBP-type peptidyl-prolyl cis-trans isomerase 2